MIVDPKDKYPKEAKGPAIGALLNVAANQLGVVKDDLPKAVQLQVNQFLEAKPGNSEKPAKAAKDKKEKKEKKEKDHEKEEKIEKTDKKDKGTKRTKK